MYFIKTKMGLRRRQLSLLFSYNIKTTDILIEIIFCTIVLWDFQTFLQFFILILIYYSKNNQLSNIIKIYIRT